MEINYTQKTFASSMRNLLKHFTVFIQYFPEISSKYPPTSSKFSQDFGKFFQKFHQISSQISVIYFPVIPFPKILPEYRLTF